MSGEPAVRTVQEMNVTSEGRLIRKGYEIVLKERGLWPKGPAKFQCVCKQCTKEKSRGYKGTVDPKRRMQVLRPSHTRCSARLRGAEEESNRGADRKTWACMSLLPEVPLQTQPHRDVLGLGKMVHEHATLSYSLIIMLTL
jgi:hypothetical protein